MANLHVNLAFSADTGKAKAQIQELQTLLSKIAYTGTTSNNLTGTMQKDIQAASAAAKDLQFHLNNAFNTTTGKFDLSLLDRSLKTSGANITDLSTKLLGAGATGQQAFMKLAQSISLADQPMLRISKRMQEFAVTMKNTVKWQLSSSMLHGFMGAIQSAYGYAQDLNKSLTDIRIVTGYSADQMAVFAEQANKAAKSLSTTTTDYTNASLIYFQQGLTDAEVAERTEVTVKMANAAGESAQIVSDQLTAVWNNFYDGSKSLEYYADVMTALGAATASSTDEISEGLSKFAAVAETVGLSYEYATAALTTITSNTRESADVVGNALKTLFARIQGLKLGETLEDGVDLNKYSEALDKAGISIFESNGELKAMDTILTELADRWDTMSSTQQVALAQTVAGVRQYTQLIALMKNWDNGDADSMMANLKTIEGAGGALDKQAEIYAQSWEAASKRVQAAAEGIYQSLLDDDFFISIANGFANLLGGLDAFIDGAGGVKTVLTGLASIALSTFAHQIPEALDTFRYNLEFVTKGSQAAYKRIQDDMNQATTDAFNKYNTTAGQQGISKDSAMGYAIEQANELTAAKNKLAIASDKMSAAEKQSANIQLSLIQAQQDEVIALKQKNEELQESIRLQQESIRRSHVSDSTQIKAGKASEDMSQTYLSYNDALIELEERRNRLIDTINNRTARGLDTSRQSDNLTRINTEIEQYESLTRIAYDFSQSYKSAMQVVSESNNRLGQELFDIFTRSDFNEALQQPIQFAQELELTLDNIEHTLVDNDEQLDFNDRLNINTIIDQVKTVQNLIPETIQSATGLNQAFTNVFNARNEDELQQAFQNLRYAIDNCTLEGQDFQRVLEGLYGKSITQIAADMQKLARDTEQANQKAATLKKLFDEFKPDHTVRMSEAMGSLAGLMGNVVTIGSSLSSIFKALFINPDLTPWERFSALLSGIATLIPSVMSSIQAFSTLMSFLNTQTGKNVMLTQAQVTAHNAEIITTNLLASTKSTLIKQLGKEQTQHLINIVAIEKEKGATEEQVAAKIIEQLASNTTISQKGKEIIARVLSKAAIDAETVSLWKLVKALLATNIAGMALGKWLLIFTAIAATIGVVVAAFNHFNNVQKEANEAITEATEKYEEEKSKLEELKNELQSVNDQIKELNSQDQLDIVSQAELDKLEARRASLEAQVALQERLAAAAQREQADTIVNNWDKSSSLSNKQEITKATGEYGLGLIETVDEYGMPITVAGYTRQQEDIDQYINRMKQTDHYNVETGRFDDVTEAFIASWRAEIEAANAEYAANNQQQYLQNEANYRAVAEYAANNANYQWNNKEQMQNDLTKQRKDMYGEDYDDLFIKPLLNAAEQVSIAKGEDGKYSVTGISQEEMDLHGISQKELNTWLNNQIAANPEAFAELEKIQDLDFSKLTPDQLFLLLDNLDQLEHFDGSSMEELIAYLTQISKIEPPGFDLNKWKSDYAKKMDIINSLETGDEISAEDYALLGEEYQQYFQVQADGTAILITKAEELRAAAQGIEIGKLEDDIHTKQATIDKMNKVDIVTDSGRTLNFNAAHNAATRGTLHETWDEAYINSVNEALRTSYTTVQEANAAYNEYVNSLNDSQNTVASTADSIDELNQKYADGLIDLEEYNANLEGTIMEEAIAEDLDPDIIIDMAEAYEHLIKSNEDWTGNQKDAEKASKKLAIANARTQKGIDDLAEGWKDWSKALKDGNKLSEKYQTAISGIEGAMEDMLGIDIGLLSEGFAESAVEAGIFERLVKGDLTALDDLRQMAATDIVQRMNLDTTNFEGAQQYLLDTIAAFEAEDIEIGTSLETTGFYDALNSLINQTDITATQIANILDAIGFEPEVTTKKIPVEQFHASSDGTQFTAQYLDSQGNTQTKVITSEQYNNAQNVGYVEVPVINAKTTVYSGSGRGGGYTPPKNSGGGGGGGGGSTPKHAEKKNDSDKERYHTLQNQLEDLKTEYDEISEAKDRAFGSDKLKNLDDEIKKTQELIDKQEEYLDAISADLPIDKAIMDEYYRQLIGGRIEYDEKGNIANFDEIQDAMYAKYNSMADRYDEESEEWKVFEKKYEQLEKYIEQYEETYDLLRDEEAEYQELLNQRLDLELEKIQYAIELKLNIAEDSLALLEYQMSRIEDDAFKAAEAVGLFAEQAELLYDQMAADREGLNDILGQQLSDTEIKMFYEGDMSVLEGKTFTEAQMEAIKEYRDNLLELNEQFDEIRENVEEQVMEVFEAWNEQLDDGIEHLEHYGDILESYRNIIDIVGEDGLGISDEFMKNLNEAQIGNAIDKVNATRDAYEAMMKAQQEAEKALEEAKERGDEASIKMWTENLDELTDEANSAQEEFLSAWEDALDTVAEQFEMTVERVIESFNESIYALGGLEGLSEEFSRQQETADMMVDDYQKIYELSKLNRDIQRTLDDTDVIAGKQKLLKLQEKINDLEAEGVEMSQYDLEYLQAEYELRMAEIELENAQKAKDTVRMSRDNEGNWSYVYTTNTDAVDEAQQKYEDALYAMQDLSSNYIDEMSEKLISTSQEMEEALASLRIQDFASIDDYYAEVERIKKEYGEQLALEQAELQKAIDNNKVLYDEDMTNYAKATGEKYRLAEEFVTSFKDSLLGSIMDSESESANFTDIIGSAVDDLTTGLMEAATTYYQNLEAAMNAADTSTGDFAEDIAANIDAVVEKSKEGAEAIDQMAIEMTEAFQEITDMVTNWQETYGMAMEKIIQSNLDVIESFNNMLEALSIDADKINVSYDINTSPEKDNPAAFDTGGYTGKWGDIGKLAVLHEKELILNENDTSNFLKAINISKVILDMIETNAKYASMGLGQITPTVIKEEAKETLEQIVHITADFSGVKDRNEIEEAFKSLINTSSQYANRK